tara:strand:- start:1438 stop:2526 length:1089 start_codon:yes stop_codon:yes gene_type:complete
MYKLIIISLSFFSLASCNDEVANQFSPKPSALGRLNEIEIISDDDVWDGSTGDSIRYYFGSSYPIMPTPEPIFDMRQFSPRDLAQEPLRRELRTYVVVADLQEDESETTKMIRQDLGEERFMNLKTSKEYSSTIGRDKWARNQLLIYIMGNGKSNIHRAIREKFPTIAKKINEHDEAQLTASIYSVRKTNLGLKRKVKEMYGIDMVVPGDYRMAVEDEGRKQLWLRRDDKKGAILNIMMQAEKYEDQSQFDTDKIKNILNTLSKQYVKTNTFGSTMIINDEDLPVYDYGYEIDGQYTRELRGVWEMTDDFMAGPFVAYGINLKESNTILYIYAFVYGPGISKRNLIQQLDHIVKNVKVTRPS